MVALSGLAWVVGEGERPWRAGREGQADRKSLGLSRSDSWFTGAGVTRGAAWRDLGSDAERRVVGEQQPSRERKVARGQGGGQWG